MLMYSQLGFQRRAAKPVFMNETMITEDQALTIDQPFNPKAWQGHKAIDLGCLHTEPKHNGF